MIPFEIRGFPMPPSVNSLYANNKYNNGRHKSQSYSAYESEVRIWMYKHAHILQNARLVLQTLERDEVLVVDHTFYFRAFRVLSKAGKPLRNDTTNRIKALDDVLSKILGIDDCYFWDCGQKKRVTPHVALGDYVDIKFSSMKVPERPEDD